MAFVVRHLHTRRCIHLMFVSRFAAAQRGIKNHVWTEVFVIRGGLPAGVADAIALSLEVGSGLLFGGIGGDDFVHIKYGRRPIKHIAGVVGPRKLVAAVDTPGV